MNISKAEYTRLCINRQEMLISVRAEVERELANKRKAIQLDAVRSLTQFLSVAGQTMQTLTDALKVEGGVM